MMETWLIWLTIGILSVSIATLGALWFWRGIWLAKHIGHHVARTRWTWYTKADKKIKRRRIQRLRAKGLAPPSVTLSVEKATHGQRTRYEKQTLIERNRNNG